MHDLPCHSTPHFFCGGQLADFLNHEQALAALVGRLAEIIKTTDITALRRVLRPQSEPVRRDDEVMLVSMDCLAKIK